MSKKVLIQPPPENAGQSAVGFYQEEFEKLIWDKGYDVIHEKALECPCKSRRTNQQSNCKNCGGTAWIFINPTKTRMVLHSMNENTQWKTWSKEIEGTVNVSVMNKDRLTYMDRITLVNSDSNFNEVSHIKRNSDDGKLFTYLSYHIKEVLYVGLYVDEYTKLRRLNSSEYTFDGNKFFLNQSFESNYTDDNKYSITISYKHQPQYHLIGFPRHVANSKITINTKDTQVDLPLSAIGRVAHFVLDTQNINIDRLLDNSYEDENCEQIIKTVDSYTKMC